LRFVDSLFVLAVDDEHKPLGACIVVPPERSDFVLAADIPDIKLYVLVGDGFHVETDYTGAMSNSV